MDEIIAKYQVIHRNKDHVTIWLRQYDYNNPKWDGTHAKEYMPPDFIVRVDVPPAEFNNEDCGSLFHRWNRTDITDTAFILQNDELRFAISKPPEEYIVTIENSAIEFRVKSLSSLKETAMGAMLDKIERYTVNIRKYQKYIKILEEDINENMHY